MKKTFLPVFLCLSLGLGVARGQTQNQLKIDFGTTASPVAAGYQGYGASDKNVASFTAQTYKAFGTNVTIQPTWVAGANAGALRMIDRGADATMENSDLLRDWIGTDTRSTPADPMTLVISGLPAGTYQWLSYHHDHNDQTGIFSVTVKDSAGSKTTDNLDISNGAGFTLANATKFTATITADGTHDVTLVFHQTSSSAVVANAIFVMNGFELTLVGTALAIAPNPANQATDVPRDGTVLSWKPIDKAVGQDVYLGTSLADVNSATTASAAYQGRQDANSYDPGRLTLGQTYYWRVDEVQTGNQVSQGSVWSFTVEPVALTLPGTGITATASSSNSANEGPGKTVDGSGLTADGLHGTDNATMWLSSPADAGPAWIQYQFDKLYKLHQMQVWNHNTSVETLIGFGIKSATITYSTDGTTWTALSPSTPFAQATGTAGYAANTSVEFGDVAAQYVRITANSNWGGIMKNAGLSEVRFLVIPETARQPVPAVGATAVDPRTLLSWRPGREAGKHQVYLSTDANAVRNGTVPAATVATASFDASSTLQLGQTYYWKVTEVNDAVKPSAWEGNVWSFSTAAVLVVDDMESYNDTNHAIYEAWVDGYNTTTNGSQVGYGDAKATGTFGDTVTVHGGKQSLPFQYGLLAGKPSEATYTFSSPQDWTLFGVKGLLLWFYGNPTNTATPMYVTINTAKVAYDGDASALLTKGWHLWYVDLSAVKGTNLKKVTDLTIGFEGGAGIVLFDDITLTAGSRQLVTPLAPAPTNLVAHYLFDGNVNDTTGKHSGTVFGAPTYTAGKVGQALKLDGLRDYVDCPGPYSLTSYTVALWFRVDGGSGQRDLVSIYDELGGHGILIEVGDPAVARFLHRAPVSTTGPATESIYGTSTCGDGAWYHLAAVKSATTQSLYLNGDLAASAANTTVFDKALAHLSVGVLRVDSLGRYLPGAVDDLYLYGRDLSQAEIASLAGRTQPFDAQP